MDEKNYLLKSDFYQYMGDFRQVLEQRLARLETKICNGKDHGHSGDKIIFLLVGAVLVLAGATAGAKLFGGLF